MSPVEYALLDLAKLTLAGCQYCGFPPCIDGAPVSVATGMATGTTVDWYVPLESIHEEVAYVVVKLKTLVTVGVIALMFMYSVVSLCSTMSTIRLVMLDSSGENVSINACELTSFVVE
jgi:hypothetical protein